MNIFKIAGCAAGLGLVGYGVYRLMSDEKPKAGEITINLDAVKTTLNKTLDTLNTKKNEFKERVTQTIECIKNPCPATPDSSQFLNEGEWQDLHKLNCKELKDVIEEITPIEVPAGESKKEMLARLRTLERYVVDAPAAMRDAIQLHKEKKNKDQAEASSDEGDIAADIEPQSI